MRTIALLLTLVALPCSAGQVYRCTGPDGSITFTNIACPAKATVQHYDTYAPAPDSPTQVPPPLAVSAPPNAALPVVYPGGAQQTVPSAGAAAG